MPQEALDKLLSFTHKLRETQDPTVSLDFLFLTGCCFMFLEFSALKSIFLSWHFYSNIMHCPTHMFCSFNDFNISPSSSWLIS